MAGSVWIYANPCYCHSGMVRRTRPQMRNCASGNLEIPGSLATLMPRNDESLRTINMPGNDREIRSPRTGIDGLLQYLADQLRAADLDAGVSSELQRVR